MPTLHLLCGKIAAGKSTLAEALSHSEQAVLIAEDTWLSALFAEEMTSIADYVRFSAKLRSAMKPHICALLNNGTSVVLDFHANTIETRFWMAGIVEATGADHQLHFLDVPDAVCLERLNRRNAKGNHPFAATEEQFHMITKHFVAPSPEEGFNIVHYDGND